ncbi:MAG: SH3 domain-containing protein [Lachnospiraceae bacterium]|nr:SH3 domain-containing protein [Lachnospiraceae bacterium]MCI1398410.1 SH3 domain-containing protein [Lachnospiraceae bacterium]MCI1424597.1 SH3 domain-containing protein [Lachnospiraceae bacterium]MCI1453305.1 SH3 domain-containing protein [Lachnospiraceae bacterium]
MKKWMKRAGAGLLTAFLLWQGAALPGLAASTGTVTASDVNIRQDASTSAGIVGAATLGETYAVGDSKQDADGNTWYQITLTDGQTGYIRQDFITVEEDAANAASTEEDTTEHVPYAITKETADDGTITYYFEDSSNGLRLSLDEIAQMTDQVAELQAELPSAGESGRVAVIVLILLLILAGVVDVSLYTRLLNEARAGNRPGTLLSRKRPAGTAGRTGAAPGKSAARSRKTREKERTPQRPEPAGTVSPEPAKEKPIMDFTFGNPVTEEKKAPPKEKPETEESKEPRREDSALPPKDTFAGKILAQQAQDQESGKDEKKTPEEGSMPDDAAKAQNGPAIPTFGAGEAPGASADAADEPRLRPHAINWAAEEPEQTKKTPKAEDSDPNQKKDGQET